MQLCSQAFFPGAPFTNFNPSNYIHCKVWDEIIYPFPNLNGYTVEVWEWISNFISYFTGRIFLLINAVIKVKPC